MLGRGRCEDALKEGIEQAIVGVVLLPDLVELVEVLAIGDARLLGRKPATLVEKRAAASLDTPPLVGKSE